jgi:outer membrane protein assembly factor BamB
VSGIAVAGGMVYAGAGTTSPPLGIGVGVLYAFDAAGVTNCSNTQCSPVWKAGLADKPSAPAVANGVVYIGTFFGPLYAFDAAGNTGCTPNSTRVCAPLWIANTGPNSVDSPAVANGVVYVGGQSVGGSSTSDQLLAFDASGATNCSGAPKTCTPIYTSNSTFAALFSSPAVANGYVYLGDAVLDGGRGGVVTGVAAFHFG